MNMNIKLILFTIFMVCNLTECRSRHRRQTKPIISDDCQTFRTICSELCFKNVENDQCWGSPRYTQCICNDRTIHQLPEYPCEHPECPKDVVRGGTTRKPINRVRRPINRGGRPIRKDEVDE